MPIKTEFTLTFSENAETDISISFDLILVKKDNTFITQNVSGIIKKGTNSVTIKIDIPGVDYGELDETKGKIENTNISPPVIDSLPIQSILEAIQYKKPSPSPNFTPGSPSRVSGPPRNKTITSGFYLKPTGHRAVNTNKTEIVLHYSAGNQRTDHGEQTVRVLNARCESGLTYHYIIDAIGQVEEVIPNSWTSYNAGILAATYPTEANKGKSMNTTSVAVNLQNLGVCDSNRSDALKGPIPPDQSQPVKLVDWNGRPFTYRGRSFAQEITDAQYNALFPIYKQIYKDHPTIGTYKWEGEKTFWQLFPVLGKPTLPGVNIVPSGNYGHAVVQWPTKPGLYTHCSIITQKLDVLPTPKIIEFFKNLVLS